MTDIALRQFQPSDAAWLVAEHGRHYAQSDGFDDSFAPLVQSILDGFVKDHDPACERGWIAMRGSERMGSIFCCQADAKNAKLRLFYLVEAARGQGIGQQLLDQCMRFASGAGYAGMTLATHESHRAACRLYARAGWQLASSQPVRSFGQDLVEQHWVYRF